LDALPASTLEDVAGAQFTRAQATAFDRRLSEEAGGARPGLSASWAANYGLALAQERVNELSADIQAAGYASMGSAGVVQLPAMRANASVLSDAFGEGLAATADYYAQLRASPSWWRKQAGSVNFSRKGPRPSQLATQYARRLRLLYDKNGDLVTSPSRLDEPPAKFLDHDGIGVPRAPGDTPAYPNQYSVAFEVVLDPSDFELSRAEHFQIGNRALSRAREENPALASLVPEPSRWGSPPVGWVWQHATSTQGALLGKPRPGVLHLVPTAQHTAGSAFWSILHPLPGGAGGYSEWAIPAGAPPNR
jgi:hypothetical protein